MRFNLSTETLAREACLGVPLNPIRVAAIQETMLDGLRLVEDRLKGDSDAQRLKVLVKGRVQGVFFRRFVARHAHRLSLAGSVRNLPDGATVEVVAEGTQEALADMLALLGEGPPGARVDETEAEWSAARSEPTTFQVRP